MPFIVTAALLLWDCLSFFSVVQFSSRVPPIYVYTINTSSELPSPVRELLRCDFEPYVFFLQYSTTATDPRRVTCEEFLASDTSLDALHLSITVGFPLFSSIVRFNYAASVAGTPWIDFISPTTASLNSNTDRSTDAACLPVWFIGVEGSDYRSLVVSDVDFLSVLVTQESSQRGRSEYPDFSSWAASRGTYGEAMQLSNLDVLSLDARLMAYDSFSDVASRRNSGYMDIQGFFVDASSDSGLNGICYKMAESLSLVESTVASYEESLTGGRSPIWKRGGGNTFMAVSGVRDNAHIVDYWLSYCGLDSSVSIAYLWDLFYSKSQPSPFTFTDRGEDMTGEREGPSVCPDFVLSSQSGCRVQRIVGLPAHARAKLHPRPVCLEDLIEALYSVDPGDPVDVSGESSEASSEALIFVSSVGSQYFLPSSSCDAGGSGDCGDEKNRYHAAFLRSRRAEYLELLSVLKAADNLLLPRIAVRSLWGGTSADLRLPASGDSNEMKRARFGRDRSSSDGDESCVLDIIGSDRTHNSTGAFDRPLSSAARTSRLQVSQGDVHVLVFLLAHQVPIGEQIVQARRVGAPSSASGLYIRYAIMTVPPDLACSTSVRAADSLACPSAPSLRSSLIATHRWIDTYAVYSDIVFTLVGMEALLAALQPASPFELTGVVPLTEYGQTNSYRMSSDVVVGSKEGKWEVRTMVGQASALRILLRAAMTDPLYAFASERQIADIIVGYSRSCAAIIRAEDGALGSESNVGRRSTHCVEVAVDSSDLAFNFTAAAKAMSNIDREGLYSQHDEATLFKDTCTNRTVQGTKAEAFEERRSKVRDLIRATVHPISATTGPLTTASYYPVVEVVHELQLGGCWMEITHLMVAVMRAIEVRRTQQQDRDGGGGGGASSGGVSVWAQDRNTHILSGPFFHLGKNIRFFHGLVTLQEFRVSAAVISSFLGEISLRGLSHYVTDSGTKDLKSLSEEAVLRREEEAERLLRERLIPVAMYGALAEIYRGMGSYEDMVGAMYRSVLPGGYLAVKRGRDLWEAQRQLLARDEDRRYRIRFVTMASEETENLSALRLSAALSGVHLTVVGLGEPYADYSAKVHRYNEYLQRMVPQGGLQVGDAVTVTEDDVIVLIDAYDVLLLPAVRTAGKFLSESPTPVVFCAENGLYPDFSSGSLYQRGAHRGQSVIDKGQARREGSEDDRREKYLKYGFNLFASPLSDPSSGDPTGDPVGNFRAHPEDQAGDLLFPPSLGLDGGIPKFLNSGCIVGRAGQVRDMFSVAAQQASAVRDDQQIFVRYAHSHPEVISLDLDRQLFFTGYKEASAVHLVLMGDLTALGSRGRGDALLFLGTGVFHCNNMKSNRLYDLLLHELRRQHLAHFCGPDGPYLLRALWHLWDLRPSLAMGLLNRPEVRGNMTSLGGSNAVGDVLMVRAGLAMKVHRE